MPCLTSLAAALSKKRISIDQCFLSNMCKGDAKLQKLLDSLLKAHAHGKIICPIHLEESIFESTFLPQGLRKKIFDLQNSLSDGFSFHSLAQQLRYQTGIFLMPELMYPMLREVSLKILPGTDFEMMAKAHKVGKNAYADRVNKRPYPPPDYQKGMKGEQIMKFVAMERCGSMYRLLEAIKATGTLNTGKEEWELAVEIAEFLLKINIRPEGCDLLIHKVLHHEWECIPYLWVHTRINAQLELGYISGFKKATANDLLDLTRIAIGLNDADVVLCDTAMSELIKQSKVLETVSRSKVFSMQQVDEAADFVNAM